MASSRASSASCAEVLGRCAPVAAALVPRYDWHARGAGASRGRCRSRARLIVEGVGAGARAVAPYTSLLVWIELPSEARRERAAPPRRPHYDRPARALGAPGGRVLRARATARSARTSCSRRARIRRQAPGPRRSGGLPVAPSASAARSRRRLDVRGGVLGRGKPTGLLAPCVLATTAEPLRRITRTTYGRNH